MDQQSTRKRADLVVNAVCAAFGTSPAALRSKSRLRMVARPRQGVAMLLRHARLPWREIQRHTGHVDHWGVIKAARRAEEEMQADPAFARRVRRAAAAAGVDLSAPRPRGQALARGRGRVQGAVLRRLRRARGEWVSRADLIRAAYGKRPVPARGWGSIMTAMTRLRPELDAAGLRIDWSPRLGWRLVACAVEPPKDRTYRRWTVTEEATAREMYAAGRSMCEIAEAIDRTKKAVEQHLREVRKWTGEAARPRGRPPKAPRRQWTEAEDVKLLRLLKRPKPFTWIAAQMGCSVDAAKARAWKLRNREKALRPRPAPKPVLPPVPHIVPPAARPGRKPALRRPVTDAIFAGCFRGQNLVPKGPQRPALTLRQVIARYRPDLLRRAGLL